MRKIAALSVAALMGMSMIASTGAEARGRGGLVAAGVVGGLAAGAFVGAAAAGALGGPGYDDVQVVYPGDRYRASVVDSFDPPLEPRVNVPRFDPNVSGYRPEFGVVGWYGSQRVAAQETGYGYEPLPAPAPDCGC